MEEKRCVSKTKHKEQIGYRNVGKILSSACSSTSRAHCLCAFQNIISFCEEVHKPTSPEDGAEEEKDLLEKPFHLSFLESVLFNNEWEEYKILGLKALFSYYKFKCDNRSHFAVICEELLESLEELISNKKCSKSDYNGNDDCVLFCSILLQFYENAWRDDYTDHCSSVFYKLFQICSKMAFTYSSATLLSFKCLVIIIRICKTCSICKPSPCHEVCDEFQFMDIIMANWENPISGVRKQVKLLFGEWLQCDEFNVTVERDFESFELESRKRIRSKIHLLDLLLCEESWTVCYKYHMLAAILEAFNCSIYEILQPYEYEIKSGLRSSLDQHDLAIAGTELYKALLKGFSEEQWKTWFQSYIVDLLKSGSRCVVQNIFKHWMTPTLNAYKSFIIFDILDNKYPLSSIKLMGIKRKHGVVLDNENKHFLQKCLVCCDEAVRSDAFSVVCLTKTSDRPEMWEFEFVKQFSIENVNYDQSSLRQSMVNSCVTFFLRIRHSVLFKLNHGFEIDDELDFLVWMHEFLIANLKNGSNYQRKYTSLLLYDAVLIYFGTKGIQDNRTQQRKSNSKEKSYLIEEQAKNHGKWNFKSKSSRNVLFSCINDISETVRTVAADILANNFTFDKDDLSEIIDLYKTANDLCSCHLFHKVESGALLIKTVTELAYKDESGQLGRNLISGIIVQKNVLSDLLEVAQRQSVMLFKDIFNAAINGSPLHGVLNAVMLLLTNKNSPEFNCLSEEQLETLLKLLETDVKVMIGALSISRNDCSPTESAFAPSFAEMGESLEEIVRQSEVNYSQDEAWLLPVPHQIILNCIWFNLKVCCLLASRLITSGIYNGNKTASSRCMSILELVLSKCRHKGAMEVAGLAMMSATKVLMTHQNDSISSEMELPDRILDNIFGNILMNSGSTLSRRSAGLSILVHSIVTGDSLPNNPLLNKSLKKLIEIANENVVVEGVSPVDIPQVSSLHILSRLVQDPKLVILHHVTEIFTICFNNLDSPLWTVKNAALQLFNSLIMRIMRRTQKDHQNDSDLDNEYNTTPLEEFYFHMSDLFILIEDKLDILSSSNDIIDHLKLIPILVLLSNITVTFSKFFNSDYEKSVNKIRLFVEKLLSSPIHVVRKLSARISSYFVLPSELLKTIYSTNEDIESLHRRGLIDQNLLNGLILKIKYSSARVIKMKNQFEITKNKCYGVKSFSLDEHGKQISEFLIMLLRNCKLSDYTRVVVIEVIDMWKTVPRLGYDGLLLQSDQFKKMVNTITSFKNNLGSSIWLGKQVQILMFSNNFNLKFINFCLLECTIPDVSIAFLKALQEENFILPFSNSSLDLQSTFIKMIAIRKEPEIIELMLKSLLHKSVCDFESVRDIFELVVKNSKFGFKCKCLGLMIACQFIGSKPIFRSTEDERSVVKSIDVSNFRKTFLEIVECVSEWSNPSISNEEMRRTSAHCVVSLATILSDPTNLFDGKTSSKSVFAQIADKIGALIWSTVFNLLQDENLEVRIKASEFYSRFCKQDKEVLNPFVCLTRLIRINFMTNMMNFETALDQLWTAYNANCNNEKDCRSEDLLNPFDHGVYNFYKEQTWLNEMIHNEFKQVSKENSICSTYLRRITESKAITEVQKNSVDFLVS